MVRSDTQEISGLRDIFGFYEQYDIFLACEGWKAWGQNRECTRHRDALVYDSVVSVAASLGKTVYVPHREEARLFPGDYESFIASDRMAIVESEIIAPTCDLMIADLGVPDSLDVSVYMGSLLVTPVPLLSLYESKGPMTPRAYIHLYEHLAEHSLDSLIILDNPVCLAGTNWSAQLNTRLSAFYEGYEST